MHESSAYHGAGLGLRAPHYQTILDTLPAVPWFEALTDNYLNSGGMALFNLEQIRQHYPLTFHGVGLSLGSTDPLDENYLKALESLIQRFEPIHISDHLCWTSANGVHSNDLLPLPYTEEAVIHISNRIDAVQNRLQQRILIENVSSYVTFTHSDRSEVEFLCEVVQRADCDLLCDINNIYVSAHNHGFDPLGYIDALPKEKIRELHLAGYEDQGTHLLDTHGSAVHAPVWDLFEAALKQLGPIPTLIEWDNNIPDFSMLALEREKAQSLMSKYDD